MSAADSGAHDRRFHRALHPVRSGILAPLLPFALIAGFFEGIGISLYSVWANGSGAQAALQALLCVAVVVVVHLVCWSVVGLLLSLLIPPRFLVTACFLVWIASCAHGRILLDDRFMEWSWWLVAISVSAALALPVARRVGALLSLPGPRREQLAGAFGAVAALSGGWFALAGRVPDYTAPATAELLLAGTSAVGALGATVLLLKRPIVLGALALISIPLAWALGPHGTTSGRPNVLWIMVDTARRDFVPPFDVRVENDAISKLAATGVLFENAVTVVPKTTPSVASYLTGLYPKNHGVRGLFDRLPQDRITLAEILAENGYDTKAFVNNPWTSRGRGFDQGFGAYYDFFTMLAPYGPLGMTSWVVALDQWSLGRLERFRGQTSATLLVDFVMKHLHAKRQRPFFYYVHFLEPHPPYFPPEELAKRYGGPEGGRTLVNFRSETSVSRGQMYFANPLPEKENEGARRLYAAEMDDTLRQVERLLEGIDQLGLARDTFVIFTADHGHSLGEHRYFFHHGAFLYDVTIRIPLVLSWPGHLPAGRVVRQQVRSIDVTPTVLALLGISAPVEADGVVLERLWEDPELPSLEAFLESDEKMFEENDRRELKGVPGKLRALRTERFKLILTPRKDGQLYELYDLIEDPEELVDLSESPDHRAVFDDLVERLWAHVPPGELRGRAEAHVPSGAEREMLQSLGYIE